MASKDPLLCRRAEGRAGRSGAGSSAWAARATAAVMSAAITGSGCVTILGDFEAPSAGSSSAESGAGGSSASSSGGSGGGVTVGSGGDGGSGGESSSAMSSGSGGAGGGSVGCPGGRGPEMVKVPGPSGADYCVDATEVTSSHYAEWLKQTPSTDGQPEQCAGWNKGFQPSKMGPCQMFAFDVSQPSERPMVCIDWCDAYAFCAWAGKRLCGEVGGAANSFDNPNTPESQWYRACSQDAMRAYPYGNVYDPSACVGSGYNGDITYEPTKDHAIDVRQAAGCEGGYPGLFDMSGNVAEWEDACGGQMGVDDLCLVRSGSYASNPAELTCVNVTSHSRSSVAVERGFRCCADLP